MGAGLDEADIAKALSVSARMVRGYLSDVKADLRKQQREKVFSLWLQCWTQEQIAEAVGLDQSEVSREIGEVCQLEAVPNNTKLAAMYQDADWQPPLFDVWTAASRWTVGRIAGPGGRGYWGGNGGGCIGLYKFSTPYLDSRLT